MLELFKSGPAQINRMDFDEEWKKYIQCGGVHRQPSHWSQSINEQLALDVCMNGGSASMANSQGLPHHPNWPEVTFLWPARAFMAFSSLHASKNTQ